MKVLGKEQEDVQACKSYDTSRTAAQATNTQVMAVPCILQDEYFVMFVSGNFLQILGPYSTHFHPVFQASSLRFTSRVACAFGGTWQQLIAACSDSDCQLFMI